MARHDVLALGELSGSHVETVQPIVDWQAADEALNRGHAVLWGFPQDAGEQFCELLAVFDFLRHRTAYGRSKCCVSRFKRYDRDRVSAAGTRHQVLQRPHRRARAVARRLAAGRDGRATGAEDLKGDLAISSNEPATSALRGKRGAELATPLLDGPKTTHRRVDRPTAWAHWHFSEVDPVF